MRECGHGPGLRPRAHQAEDGRAGQRLDGDVPLEPEVARQVDRPHSSLSQTPRQPVLARQQLRPLRLDVRGPAVARRRLTGLRHASARRALLGRRRVRRPGFASVRIASTRSPASPATAASASRNGRSTGRASRPSRRRPATRTPNSSAPGPGIGTTCVGARLDDPPPVVMRQQVAVRRFVLRMDPKRAAGRLQHADDGGRTRQGRHLAVRIGEVVGFRRRQRSATAG